MAELVLMTYEDPYPGKSDEDLVEEVCGRCGGSGFLREYAHNQNGVCFGCEGHPRWETPVYVLRNRERRRILKVNRALKKAHEEDLATEKRIEEFAAAYPEEWSRISLEARDPRQAFWHSLQERVEKFGELSERQLQVVQERLVADAADPVMLPEGRHEVVGKILAIKEQPSPYRRGGVDLKTLVEDGAGWRVWGTLPKALAEAKTGDQVTFTATLTRSDRDQDFGFFSRPTKARAL